MKCIENITGLDEKRLCSLTGDSRNMIYLKCWYVEIRLAPMIGWTLENKHAVLSCHAFMPLWDTGDKVWSTVRLRAGCGEDYTKGFTEAGGVKEKPCALNLKYMLSEAKKLGAFSQPSQVSNS